MQLQISCADYTIMVINKREVCIEMRKYHSMLIAIILFVIILIILISTISISKRNNIHLIQGKIVNTFEGAVYNDGTFFIETDYGIYLDSSLTLDLINQRFKINIQIGDIVCVLGKMSSMEIGPVPIQIYLVFKK